MISVRLFSSVPVVHQLKSSLAADEEPRSVTVIIPWKMPRGFFLVILFFFPCVFEPGHFGEREH